MADGREFPATKDGVVFYGHTHKILVNEARAMRVAEVMNDFRTLQYYIAQFDADSSDEDYYEEGYEVLRECISQALVVLAALYDTSTLQSSGSGGEPERRQLQR